MAYLREKTVFAHHALHPGNGVFLLRESDALSPRANVSYWAAYPRGKTFLVHRVDHPESAFSPQHRKIYLHHHHLNMQHNAMKSRMAKFLLRYTVFIDLGVLSKIVTSKYGLK